MSAEAQDWRVGRWEALAACRGKTGLMFASDTFSERLAVLVCRSCPVRPECEADARLTEPPLLRFGVVAGLTPQQRTAWDG